MEKKAEELEHEKYHDYQDYIIADRERKLKERNNPQPQLKNYKRKKTANEGLNDLNKTLNYIIKILAKSIMLIIKCAFVAILIIILLIILWTVLAIIIAAKS